MRALSAISLILASFLATSPAHAEATAEDWRYVSRVNAITHVNKALWTALEDQSGWDPEVARYARKANALNLAQLQRWRAPRREFMTFHREFVAILETIDKFYGAIGASDFERAQANGARIQNQMIALEESWQTLAATFE